MLIYMKIYNCLSAKYIIAKFNTVKEPNAYKLRTKLGNRKPKFVCDDNEMKT